MKSLSENWYGIDANKETSLFEYGLLVQGIDKDAYQVVYSIGNDLFDTATITNVECNYLTKESWFDFKGFLSYVGLSSEDWYNTSIVNKLFDLMQYYGWENIFGSSYYGMSETEVRQLTGL